MMVLREAVFYCVVMARVADIDIIIGGMVYAVRLDAVRFAVLYQVVAGMVCVDVLSPCVKHDAIAQSAVVCVKKENAFSYV